jgi:pimeloyl-ACP methyl ester carboxylesterase
MIARLVPLLLLQAVFLLADAVGTIANRRLTVSVEQRQGQLALLTESDLSTSQPGITRAIIVFHGLHRNSGGYLHDVEEARTKAGAAGQNTLLIAPQFLNDEDAHAYKIPSDVLRWRGSQWEGGGDATGPAPISSYDCIDALLGRLSDRSLFPKLKEIILAGHSGGGQVVQRYAVTGHRIAAVEAAGISVRYVVANPSSYLYFNDVRPVTVATFGCRGFNEWKYGLEDTPRYVDPASVPALEAAYIARRVTYLLGTRDDDPNGPDIDKNCAAEAQGPTRLRRGVSYFKYLQSRHITGLQHRVMLVPGVSHNARAMFTSDCGIDALFETGACQGTK